MSQKKLLQIKFGSFIGLCISIYGAFGFVLGLLMLVISILGGDARVDLFFIQLSGIPAGIAGLIIAPLVLAFTGLIFGAIAYLPFNFYLKIRRGIIIDGKWEEEEKEKEKDKLKEDIAPLLNLDKQSDLARQI